MRIHLVCVEDGLIALGFRKMAGLVKSIHPDTHSFYVPLARRSMWRRISAQEHERNAEAFADEVAETIAHARAIEASLGLDDLASRVGRSPTSGTPSRV